MPDNKARIAELEAQINVLKAEIYVLKGKSTRWQPMPTVESLTADIEALTVAINESIANTDPDFNRRREGIFLFNKLNLAKTQFEFFEKAGEDVAALHEPLTKAAVVLLRELFEIENPPDERN